MTNIATSLLPKIEQLNKEFTKMSVFAEARAQVLTTDEQVEAIDKLFEALMDLEDHLAEATEISKALASCVMKSRKAYTAFLKTLSN